MFGKMQSGELFDGVEMTSGGLGLGYKNAVCLLEYMRNQGDIDEGEFDDMPF